MAFCPVLGEGNRFRSLNFGSAPSLRFGPPPPFVIYTLISIDHTPLSRFQDNHRKNQC